MPKTADFSRFSAVSGRIPVFALANRPAPVNLERPRSDVASAATVKALQRFNPSIRAETSGDRTIQIFGLIGEDYWTGEGNTVKTVSAALAALGSGDIEVEINSPGGDVFEGIGIYNLLASHDGNVTVKVLGIAASAASIIAMAGDKVEMGHSTFLMIHNAWVYAAGNKTDLRGVADYLEPFDAAICDVYVNRCGMKAEAIAAMMDAETYLDASKAISLGLADSMMTSKVVSSGNEAAAKEQQSALATRQAEAALMKTGLTRSQARALIKTIKAATPDAGSPPAGTQDAADTTTEQGSLDFTAALLAAAAMNLTNSSI